MSNREFTATRTMLANAFATAGAELLEYMGTAAALAAIPNTEPPKYVAAGTLAMIAKVLPSADAPAAATVLTDERILRASEETAINYVTDERRPDNATIIDFARAIEREALAHAGVGAAELPAILFDGHSVFQEITSHLGKGHCYSPDAVSATLDAIVRLMRKALATPSPQAQAAVSEQTAAEARRAALDEAITVCKRNRDWQSVDGIRALQKALATKEAAAAEAPSEGLSEHARETIKSAADALAYAAYNYDGSKLEDLKPGLVESTGVSDTALIAERDLRALLAPASSQGENGGEA